MDAQTDWATFYILSFMVGVALFGILIQSGLLRVSTVLKIWTIFWVGAGIIAPLVTGNLFALGFAGLLIGPGTIFLWLMVRSLD